MTEPFRTRGQAATAEAAAAVAAAAAAVASKYTSSDTRHDKHSATPPPLSSLEGIFLRPTAVSTLSGGLARRIRKLDSFAESNGRRHCYYYWRTCIWHTGHGNVLRRSSSFSTHAWWLFDRTTKATGNGQRSVEEEQHINADCVCLALCMHVVCALSFFSAPGRVHVKSYMRNTITHPLW